MSVKVTKDGTIIFSGFEKGIAASPHEGIGDMRNVNLLGVPGEASVNFKMSAMTKPPTVTTLAFSVATTDIFTVASTSGWYNGMAVTLNTVVTAVGVVTGRVYWVGNLTATTFKLYKNPSLAAGQLADVTTAGTGTMSSYTLSKPIAWTTDPRFYTGPTGSAHRRVYILDEAGRVWWIYNAGGTLANSLVYLGNDTLTGTTGRAIAYYNRYILVFRTASVDYILASNIDADVDLDGVSGWTYGWASVSSTPQQPRPLIVGADNAVYYDNDGVVGSIIETPGDSFDPTDAASYTQNNSALDLPNNTGIFSLGELGRYLLVGGSREAIYPWDRISPSFELPIIIPEYGTYFIVSGNNLAWLFSGSRGRVYVTNGSSVEEYAKVPDYVSGVQMPYYSWSWATLWKNQLLFSFTATTNASVALTSTGGVWSIDTKDKVMRGANLLSYATYGGTASVIVPDVLTYAQPGSAIYVGWDLSGAYGVDYPSTEPYQDFEARIDTEIAPLGTYIDKYTPRHFEFKLARPLVAGEKIRLSARPSLADSFVVLGTTTTATLVSDAYDTNFEDAQWVQLRAEYSSTATTPSYVPLTEIRMNGAA